MSSHRVLRILGLFSLERPVLSVPWLVEQLQASRASVYRDVLALVEAGLLERVDARGYALGARIVELDRQIRLADPLLQAAGDLPQQLAAQSGGTVLLCRLHEDTVLCILKADGPDALDVSYERGRAMPLYRGATSKILLAHVPPARLRRLVEDDRDALARAGLPKTLPALQQALEPLRTQGHALTRAEVDRDAVGLAVPLLDGARLLGSLSVVLPAHASTPTVEKRALSLLKSCALRIQARTESARQRSRTTKRHVT